MYSIGYNFTIDDHVWVADGTNALECVVTQITLEVDPEESGLVEITTYHLRPLNTHYKIILRDTSVVFATLEEVVEYISDPELTAPQLDTHTIDYMYTVGDMVWVLSGYAILESEIIQITFDVDPGPTERILYHALPVSEDFSTLIREEEDVYETKQDAADYLKSTF